MAESRHQGDGPVQNPGVRRERTDLSLRAILIVLGVALALGVFFHVAVWGFFRDHLGYQARVKVSPFPLAPEPSTALPREPRLEQVERLDDPRSENVGRRMRVKEDALN